jgi:hypothetical protein
METHSAANLGTRLGHAPRSLMESGSGSSGFNGSHMFALTPLWSGLGLHKSDLGLHIAKQLLSGNEFDCIAIGIFLHGFCEAAGTERRTLISCGRSKNSYAAWEQSHRFNMALFTLIVKNKVRLSWTKHSKSVAFPTRRHLYSITMWKPGLFAQVFEVLEFILPAYKNAPPRLTYSKVSYSKVR